MSQLVTYEFSVASVATSGEVYVGVVTAPAGDDAEVKAVEGMLLDTASAATPVTWRLRALSAAGTGTSVTGQKTNRLNTASIGTTGQQGSFSVAPTAISGSPQDSATIAFNAPFFATYPSKLDGSEGHERLIVKAGESMGFTIERNGGTATGTPTARVTIQVRE